MNATGAGEGGKRQEEISKARSGWGRRTEPHGDGAAQGRAGCHAVIVLLGHVIPFLFFGCIYLKIGI
jgi:hypothetical protein